MFPHRRYKFHVVDHEHYYNKLFVYTSSNSLLAFYKTKKIANFTKLSNMMRAFIKQFYSLTNKSIFISHSTQPGSFKNHSPHP